MNRVCYECREDVLHLLENLQFLQVGPENDILGHPANYVTGRQIESAHVIHESKTSLVTMCRILPGYMWLPPSWTEIHPSIPSRSAAELSEYDGAQKHSSNGEMVAIKIQMRSPDYMVDTYILDEIRMSSGFSHPHILPIFYVAHTSTYIFMVMPYVGVNLATYMTENKIPFSQKVAIAHQMVTVVRDLNDHMGYVHQDLKPQNFLIHPNGSFLWLCDFGLARPLHFSFHIKDQDVYSLWWRPPELMHIGTILGGSRVQGLGSSTAEVPFVSKDLHRVSKDTSPDDSEFWCDLLDMPTTWLRSNHFTNLIQLIMPTVMLTDQELPSHLRIPALKVIHHTLKMSASMDLPWLTRRALIEAPLKEPLFANFPLESSDSDTFVIGNTAANDEHQHNVITVIRGMLQLDPDKRITLGDLLRLPLWGSLPTELSPQEVCHVQSVEAPVGRSLLFWGDEHTRRLDKADLLRGSIMNCICTPASKTTTTTSGWSSNVQTTRLQVADCLYELAMQKTWEIRLTEGSSITSGINTLDDISLLDEPPRSCLRAAPSNWLLTYVVALSLLDAYIVDAFAFRGGTFVEHSLQSEFLVSSLFYMACRLLEVMEDLTDNQFFSSLFPAIKKRLGPVSHWCSILLDACRYQTKHLTELCLLVKVRSDTLDPLSVHRMMREMLPPYDTHKLILCSGFVNES